MRSSPAIRYEERLALIGPTRCGKSTLARRLVLGVEAPRLILDPQDSSATAITGAVTFSDPGRATNAAGENWREAATARFVPRDPADLDAYDAVYAWAFRRFPRYLWCDEAGIVLPVRSTPPAAFRYLVQGAKRMLGHLACHTRPRELNMHVLGSAAHVLVWPLGSAADRRYVAECIGIPAGQLDELLARAGALAVAGDDGAPKPGFVWWNRTAQELTVCPPLRRGVT